MQGRDEAVLTDRRRFTVEMAMALLGGAAITIGCGGGGGSPSGPSTPATPTPPRATPAPPAGMTFGDIAENHGHEVVIMDAELLAGGALSLTLGGAAHIHFLELSAEQVARIRSKEVVETRSSEGVGLFGPHSHPIRFN